MRAAAALAATGAVLLLVTARRPGSLTERVGAYLRITPEAAVPRDRPPDTMLRLAGLHWTLGELRVRRALAAVAGGLAGVLVAQGDLFLAGAPRSVPGLGVAGAAAGLLGLRMWLTTRRERRAARLRAELPTVVDTLALQVIAGESVASGLEHVASWTQGVVADELSAALADYRQGSSLVEALTRAGHRTAHPDAARLYLLLAHAHGAGGRLADSLAALAADYRGALARELTAEGGRRALATYGPILALMVPTTVAFLIYPTLVGLRLLAGAP